MDGLLQTWRLDTKSEILTADKTVASANFNDFYQHCNQHEADAGESEVCLLIFNHFIEQEKASHDEAPFFVRWLEYGERG